MGMRGAEHYLPVVRDARNPGRSEPLFPGYLFCHVEIPSVQWVEIRSLPGIAYVLGVEGRPIPVPDELVEDVRARVERENARRAGGIYSPGERVRIVEGPFKELDAIFDRRLSASGRSRVLVRLLHRLVPVEIHEASLSRN